jgi:RES domain-containing protein
VLANAGELAGEYVVTPIELPDDLGATTLSIETLPSNWDAGQPTDETAEIGTHWANHLTTAVLVVPSAVIPRECNCILNPRHPDFCRIRFLSPEPFHFDARLRRTWLNG